MAFTVQQCLSGTYREYTCKPPVLVRCTLGVSNSHVKCFFFLSRDFLIASFANGHFSPPGWLFKEGTAFAFGRFPVYVQVQFIASSHIGPRSNLFPP